MKCTIPKFELIRLLLRHRKLADDRSLSAKENKFAKFFILFSILIIVIYLMGLAVGLSLIVNSDITATAAENLCIGIPFLLLIDFNMRFTMQQTPAHIIKPTYYYHCHDTHASTPSYTARSSAKATLSGSHSSCPTH